MAPKPAQNTLNDELRLEVIQGQVTHFGITENPTRDRVLLHNNMGFRKGNFEGKV